MARYPGYVCSVRKGEVAWYIPPRPPPLLSLMVRADKNERNRLTLVAFHRVFAKKQAGYKGALAWLERELGVVVGKRGGDFRGLGRVVG